MNYTAGNLIVAAAPRAPRPRQRTRVIGNKRNLTAVESRFTKVPVTELQLGMFIAELDRPWLETPFLIQALVPGGSARANLLACSPRNAALRRAQPARKTSKLTVGYSG